MPWLIKDTHDGEHASAFRCPDHVNELLDDMLYDPVLEGPWEYSDHPVYDSPPSPPTGLYWCEREGCLTVQDPTGEYRTATVAELRTVGLFTRLPSGAYTWTTGPS